MDIKLPKGYLSYSACMLWVQNRDAYRRRYYEKEDQIESPAMTFGKVIASALEIRDYSKFPGLKDVPYYPVSEHPIEVEIGGVKVFGKLDLYKPDTYTIGEVKTGSISSVNGPPWSNLKVKKHLQLPWYSLMVKTKYGKVDPVLHLIWLETRYKTKKYKIGSRMLESDSRDLELTGRMEVFKRKISEWERKKVKDLIILSALEISNDYEQYLLQKNGR